MSLYLIGAVMVQLLIISATIKHYILWGSLSWSIIVYVLEMTWFLIDYVYHDHVHLYTYDLIDENVGFKLIWGCLFVYPFFYPVGVFPLVYKNTDSTWALIFSVLIYSLGSFLSRGANLQKYYFKINPNKPFLGIAPKVFGEKILASGWWGLARHINYLGEILQSIALCLPVGTASILPWLYPLFYVMILVPRERDDDLRCSQKYGKIWTNYTKEVPYRIIPGIY